MSKRELFSSTALILIFAVCIAVTLMLHRCHFDKHQSEYQTISKLNQIEDAFRHLPEAVALKVHCEDDLVRLICSRDNPEASEICNGFYTMLFTDGWGNPLLFERRDGESCVTISFASTHLIMTEIHP
jgi:hypothetical protein